MAFPSYKEIVDLIQKGSTLEAQEKIIELREQALELQENNLELKEENSLLKDRIAKQIEMNFDGVVYWRETSNGKEGPFCPKCLDTSSTAVRLHKDGSGWYCHPCSVFYGY